MVSARKSLFTKIFAGSGGVDPYANAISDIYQDNFNEGIFTGKGIYDLKVFSEVLKEEIPENTVLSHDLLEGSYLRCALATDIFLLDGYPYKYNAFITRQKRWIRGDFQIIRWLKQNIKTPKGKIKKNPLNKLSKFKILDNLRRSLIEIHIIITIFLLIILKAILKINVWPVKGAILRGILNIAFLPHKAYISLDAIIRTIYRMTISKQKLLQWTTAEEAEKTGNTDIFSYIKMMNINIITGTLGILLLFYTKIYTMNIILYTVFI